MTVCIQELENGKVVGEWMAVSSVCAARNHCTQILKTLKNRGDILRNLISATIQQ